VVAHGNVLLTLVSHLERIPPGEVRGIAIPTGDLLR
jgi:bisphosphoglycerate-dependent phosphoglycerate mutase